MKKSLLLITTSLIACQLIGLSKPSDGLAEEVIDINAPDKSKKIEDKLEYRKKSFVSETPKDLKDDLKVGKLSDAGAAAPEIKTLLADIESGKYKNIDSLLISHGGKLILESYFRRGRQNFPHYQMSITKSLTTLALGRAIQLGYIKDINTPVIDYLKEVDRNKLAKGAEKITIKDCLHMGSGIRIPDSKKKDLMRLGSKLKGQGQAEVILSASNPVKPASEREFKYQGTDPSLVMQVIDSVVPGTAEDFIKKELLTPLGVTNYYWQKDVSDLPKSAAGCSMRSRDMMKYGQLVMNNGKWDGSQLIAPDFLKVATGRVKKTYATNYYGYFWWYNDVKVGDKTYPCITARGAGGQYIAVIKSLDLIVVATSHNKGKDARNSLLFIEEKIIPAFAKK